MGLLTQRRDGDVVVLTVDSPPANALTPDVIEEFDDALARSERDRSCAVVVITGAGDSFVVGADVRYLQEADTSQVRVFVRSVRRLFERLEHLDRPTIAAINGSCVGGGLELAMACDLRFAAAGARLGLPEVRLGLLPGAGGTQRLPRLVGRGVAFDLLYTGRIVAANEAQRIGLVDELHTGDSVVERAVSYAAELSSGARIAQAAIKRCVLAGFDGGYEAGARQEDEELAMLFADAEAPEGLRAFIEKREPVFPRDH